MTEMVDDIYSSSVRLIKIVNDFLDVSALEQGKILITPELFSLADVAKDVAHEMQSLCAAKGVELRIDPVMVEAPSVVADKQRTKQVIYNLVGNALKFTEKGSITIRALYDNNFVYTAVTDTGRGMSPENQRLLFRKFQQAASSLLTRDTTQGTGLGLYISKLIVEHSGGQIWLDYSEVGKGSTFAFSLPRPRADKPVV
jgi:two-component system sensor histidine kinase BarA